MRVVQPRDGLGLVLESAPLVVGGEHLGPQHLQGHESVQADLPGHVDDTHGAAAQLPDELVVAEVADQGAGAGGQGIDRRPGRFGGGVVVHPCVGDGLLEGLPHGRRLVSEWRSRGLAFQALLEQAGRAEALGSIGRQLRAAVRADLAIGHGRTPGLMIPP